MRSVRVVDGEVVARGSVGDAMLVLVLINENVGSPSVPVECESVVAGTIDVAVMVPIVVIRVSVRVDEVLGGMYVEAVSARSLATADADASASAGIASLAEHQQTHAASHYVTVTHSRKYSQSSSPPRPPRLRRMLRRGTDRCWLRLGNRCRGRCSRRGRRLDSGWSGFR